MKFDLKYKKITALILAIVIISLLLTGLIVTKLVKEANARISKYWFFQEAVQTGQPIVLKDAYIISNTNGILQFVYDHTTYEVDGTLEESFTGVANILIEGDDIKKVSIKPDSVEDVLEAYTSENMILSNTGSLARNQDLPIYRVMDGQVQQVKWEELVIGASPIRCVLENGAVAAVLIEQEVVPNDIRVIIKNGSDIFYSNLYVKKMSDGSLIDVNAHFAANGGTVLSLSDAQGLLLCDNAGNALEAAYEGTLHVHATQSGYVLVNELPMETYLKYVVPSEMQVSFGAEALKAQAVCARTYAYSQMHNQTYAAYGANIDDSTAFQAYHNTGRYSETDAAVDQTAGQVITCNGELITCYYYSTSPGVTNDMSSWECDDTGYIACAGMENANGLNLMLESDFNQFINQQTGCYDAASSFYRWNAVLDVSSIKEESKGALQSISVHSRNQAGYITELELTYANTTEILKNENTIRTVLGHYLQEIQLNNGQVRTDLSMVPSACFTVSGSGDGKIILRGGGFGHGIGMSQYGAKAMAESGHGYQDIIQYYYENVEVK